MLLGSADLEVRKIYIIFIIYLLMNILVKWSLIGALVGFMIGIISVFLIPSLAFVFAIIPGLLYCLVKDCSGTWDGFGEAMLSVPFFMFLIGAALGFISAKIKSGAWKFRGILILVISVLVLIVIGFLVFKEVGVI